MALTAFEKGMEMGKAEIEETFARHRSDGKTAIGALIDAATWKEFRVLCINNDLPVGDTLTVAIRDFLNQPKRGR